MSQIIACDKLKLLQDGVVNGDEKDCCWACWAEEDEIGANPLIRVCLRCKDSALQWIHQKCIDKFIKNQILSRHPEGTIIEPYPDYVSDRTLMEIADYEIRKRMKQSPGFCMEYTGEFEGLNFMDFRCSRCLDSYEVVAKKISPLRVILSDRFVCLCLLAMLICLVYLVALSAYVFLVATDFAVKAKSEAELSQLLVKSYFYPEPVDIRIWIACVMSVVCGFCSVALLIVWLCCSHYRRIQVIAK